MAAISDDQPQPTKIFGTFYSSNVQALVETSEDEYKAPPLIDELPSFTSRVPYGRAMKDKHFMLDGSWTFINHGAFGAALKEGMEAKWKWISHVESQPLRFMDRESLPLLVHVIRRLASFVDCDAVDLILVPNVTYANNTVLKSLVKNFIPGDRILSLNITYGSTKKILKFLNTTYGIVNDVCNLEFPMPPPSELVKLVTDCLHEKTKLAVFDHIASDQGVILPVKELVKACQEKGVQVLIDGAHSLGGLPLSVRDIGADYYTSNCHKWLGSPKTSGFLYVKSCHKSLIDPLVISHGYGFGFTSGFTWSGSYDYTTYTSLLTVLDFWEFYGPKSIMEYMYTTAKQGAQCLVKAWGTDLLSDIGHFGTMVLVRLPDGLLGLSVDMPRTSNDVERVQDTLHNKCKIEVPVKLLQGKLYIRISAHIYNDLKDYERVAQAILELCDD
jgi:selenocysteine lyase/cysteine desulfurase